MRRPYLVGYGVIRHSEMIKIIRSGATFEVFKNGMDYKKESLVNIFAKLQRQAVEGAFIEELIELIRK